VNVELTDNVEILRNAVIDYRDRVVPDIWAERNLYREALDAVLALCRSSTTGMVAVSALTSLATPERDA
jgi:hypothetical protein